MTRLEAGWLFLDGRLQPNLALELDEAGRIAEIVATTGAPPGGTERLALFPGFVNAHSHAFQWGLRGHVQRDERGGDFFSWRDQMFALVERLDPEAIAALSRQAFTAMRAAGYTAVGEFHYVHHRRDGSPYDPPTELAEAVIAAARQTGIRICLLHAAYLRPSGVDAEVAGGQRRFLDPDGAAWLTRHRALQRVVSDLGDDRVSLGAAPHSVRTVPADALAAIARQTSGPLHLHINEQRREIDEAQREYGARPFDVADRAGAVGPRTTLVHMTHASDDELARTAEAGAGISFCPTTERDLGDGIGPSRLALDHGINLSIGSDSQVQIDPLEELRLLEGHERLRAEARLILSSGPRTTLAARLLEIGTAGGAEALQLASGRIEVGRWADLAAIDLDDPDFAGAPPEIVPDVAVFGASPRAVRATFVAGRRRPGARLGDWDT